jgi:hypothetical protein
MKVRRAELARANVVDEGQPGAMIRDGCDAALGYPAPSQECLFYEQRIDFNYN